MGAATTYGNMLRLDASNSIKEDRDARVSICWLDGTIRAA